MTEEKKKYWRDPDIDPKAAKAITAGVDVGSVSTPAIVTTRTATTRPSGG